jgi:hypothetical protein
MAEEQQQYTAAQQTAAQTAAEQRRAAEQPQVAGEGGIKCEKCGTTLEAGALFCPECGEKVGGEKRECPVCKEKTTAEFCPHCGNRVVPLVCPNCGTENLYDFCEKCGAVLNPELEEFFNKQVEEPAAMSEAEAKRIEEAFNQAPVSQEFQDFEKKLIERQILLEERDYFNKREKRIIKVFGARPFELELPDPVEEAFRMKAYAALERTVIKRQEKILQEEWERLFPEEKKISVQQDPVLLMEAQAQIIIDEEKRKAELERTREEMEGKYNAILSQVNDEVEKEQERQRIEQERQRLEQERRRIEQEMFKNRLLGVWYHNSHLRMLTIKIHIESITTATCIYTCTHCGGSRIQYDVSFDGNRITLSARRRTGSDCTFSEYQQMNLFSGTINYAGTIMTGNLSGGNYLSFCKI